MSLSLKDLFKRMGGKRAPCDPSLVELVERQTMIEGIGELRDKTVKEIMVPRVDVAFISRDITLDELYLIIAEEGYSRYPVYEQTIDNIVGILYVKDILRRDIQEEFDLPALMRKPYFIPESKHLDDLLREFKLRKVHIAIAIDEYGGVSGIVSMEDILEVIVGEIQDEFDEDEEETIQAIDEKSYIVDARASIEEVNEVCRLHLNDEEFETIGGYVFELFGKIPLNEESAEDEQAIFTVMEIDGHKINRVKLTVKN